MEEPCAPCGLLYFDFSDLLVAIGVGVVIGYWARGASTVSGRPFIPETRIVSVQSPEPEIVKAALPSAASKALARSPAILDSSQQ